MSESSPLRAFVEDLFARESGLSALLLTPSGEPLPAEGPGADELIAQDVIHIGADDDFRLPETLPCRLLVREEDGSVVFDFFCPDAHWMLGGVLQRPLEAARRIWDAVDGRMEVDGELLFCSDLSQNTLSRRTASVSMTFDPIPPLFPEKHVNPLLDHEVICRRIARDLAADEAVASFLGLDPKAGCLEAVRSGKISFSGCGPQGDESVQHLLTCSLQDSDDTPALHVSAAVRKSGDDGADIGRLRTAAAAISRVMTALPGVTDPDVPDPIEIGGLIHAVLMTFPFRYDPVTFSGKAAPRPPRRGPGG